MADASSGGGAPRPSAYPSAVNPPPSQSPSVSLDGGLLLRLLQNPPPHPHSQTPVQAPGGPHHFLVDPAVAAVGPLFPSPSATPPQLHGGGFAWPSPSAPPPLDPYAARGGGGFGAVGGVPGNKAEKPRPGAPPPGFSEVSPGREVPNRFGGMQYREQRREPNHRHPSEVCPGREVPNRFGGMQYREQRREPNHHHPSEVSREVPNTFGGMQNREQRREPNHHHPSEVTPGREVPNTFGGMQNREQRREPNHHHPRGFGRTQTKEQWTMPPFTGGREALGRLPHGERHTPPITGGRDTASGMMNREQRLDPLSRMPPDVNACGSFGRMSRGEQHMPPITGGRMLNGEQHMPAVTGGRIPHRGQWQQEPCLTNMPQSEQRWQGHREEKVHASWKLLNANVCEMLGKMPLKEHHQVTVPTGSSVDVVLKGDRGKKMIAGANELVDDGVGEVGFEHGADGGVVVEARNFKVSYQKSKVIFAGQNEEVDDYSQEEDAIVEQLETLVIEGNGEAKGAAVQKNGCRSKDFRSDFSRGHHVSSQRVRFQRRNRACRYDIDQFTPSFLSIFESLVPSEEEIAKQKHLLTALSRLINKEWPNSKLYLYGSCANSFGFSNSDIDLCLSIDDKEMSKVDIILKLADILQAGNLQNIQALTRARVPIVKLMDLDTGLSCDICVNNLLAVVNTKLLKDYAQIDERLRQLAFIVKHWAKSRRVNETYQGTLSSYAYVIMCIHLLQRRRILPCLQEREATYCVTVDDNNCAYFDQVDKLNNYGAHNKETVSGLLWAFFHYWAYQHDYTKDVISIRTGRIISKHTKEWTRRVGNDRHLICIEDPFETSHDLGRVVDKFSIKILREEFERAANILQFDPNPSVTLFETYVPPAPLSSLVHEEIVSTAEDEL